MSSNSVLTCPVSPVKITSEDSLIAAIKPEVAYQNCDPRKQPVFLEPQLLTDKLRLREIYELRVDVWEHSGISEFVTRDFFPNGWFDELDKTALHWIVTNGKNKIIAAARLNIFNSLHDFPYYSSMKHLSFPGAMPFAFLSRLVIHPDYRQNGLSRKLVSSRMSFCETKKINWFQVFINNKRIINLFEKLKYENIGEAKVSYNTFFEPHSVNVFIRQNIAHN